MEIEKIINEIECLQPASQANRKIMDIISNPNSSLKEIVDIVKYEQGVVDKLNFSDIDLQKTIADFWEKLKNIEDLIQFSGGN